MDENARQWASRVSAWSGSGLTIAEYCRREGLAASAMGYWKRRLKKLAVPNPEEVRTSESSVRFGRVRAREVSAQAPNRAGAEVLRLEVQRVTVELPGDMDADSLGRLVDVLASRGGS